MNQKKKRLMAAFLVACFMAFAINVTNATVWAAAKEKAITLNTNKLTLSLGNQKKLLVKGTEEAVTWTSSNTKVAVVTKKGVLKSKRVGTAKITATVGKKKLYCEVTVKNPTVVFEEYNSLYYTAIFSDGFTVTAYKDDIEEKGYKSFSVTGYYADTIGAVVEQSLKKAIVKGYHTATEKTYKSVPFATYTKDWESYKKEVYKELDFYNSIDSYKYLNMVDGYVVFKSVDKINALKYNDGTHKVTMYF